VLSFTKPIFPPFIDELELRDIAVGQSLVDLRLDSRRMSGCVAVDVIRRTGNSQIIIRK
jgi:hypothetical protein